MWGQDIEGFQGQSIEAMQSQDHPRRRYIELRNTTTNGKYLGVLKWWEQLLNNKGHADFVARGAAELNPSTQRLIPAPKKRKEVKRI